MDLFKLLVVLTFIIAILITIIIHKDSIRAGQYIEDLKDYHIPLYIVLIIMVVLTVVSFKVFY